MKLFIAQRERTQIHPDEKEFFQLNKLASFLNLPNHIVLEALKDFFIYNKLSFFTIIPKTFKVEIDIFSPEGEFVQTFFADAPSGYYIADKFCVDFLATNTSETVKFTRMDIYDLLYILPREFQLNREAIARIVDDIDVTFDTLAFNQNAKEYLEIDGYLDPDHTIWHYFRKKVITKSDALEHNLSEMETLRLKIFSEFPAEFPNYELETIPEKLIVNWITKEYTIVGKTISGRKAKHLYSEIFEKFNLIPDHRNRHRFK